MGGAAPGKPYDEKGVEELDGGKGCKTLGTGGGACSTDGKGCNTEGSTGP